LRRLGYNESKQRKLKRENRRKVLCGFGHWLGHTGWKLFLVLIAVGVAVWQGWFFIRKFNPLELRTLKTIDISGNRMLTWEEIIQTSRLETGMPMSEICADSVRARLLVLPLLRDAKVNVGFFGKVKIEIEETSPLMVTLENSKWIIYSERGMTLPVAASVAYELPIASVTKKYQIKQIAEFLASMRDADESLYKSVSQVVMNEENHAMEVFFRNTDFKVLFPIGKSSGKVFADYRLLLEGLPQEMDNLKSLDMRFQGFAYANPLVQEGK